MTLGNMRANGVRSLFAYCHGCHHTAVVDISAYADHMPVPTFGPKMRCTNCGHAGADVRPNWVERKAVGTFSGSAVNC